MGTMPCQSNFTQSDDLAYDEKHAGWLDVVFLMNPEEYAALAHSFFELAVNQEHFQAFLRDTQRSFELATNTRREP